MKRKKKLPLQHPWRRDKVGNGQNNQTARELALAEVKRRQQMYALCKD